jgi:hypothetical protein
MCDCRVVVLLMGLLATMSVFAQMPVPAAKMTQQTPPLSGNQKQTGQQMDDTRQETKAQRTGTQGTVVPGSG